MEKTQLDSTQTSVLLEAWVYTRNSKRFWVCTEQKLPVKTLMCAAFEKRRILTLTPSKPLLTSS